MIQKIGHEKWLLLRYILEMFRNLDLAFPAAHFRAFTRVFSFLFCLLVRLRCVYFFGVSFGMSWGKWKK